MKIENKLLLFVLMPLFVGGFIYVSFRSDTLLMFDWFGILHLTGIIDMHRNIMSNIQLPDILTNSIPCALWIFSFLMYIEILIKNKFYKNILIFLIIFWSIFFEVFQDYFISGTFCEFDLIFNFIAMVIFLHFKRKWILAEMLLYIKYNNSERT